MNLRRLWCRVIGHHWQRYAEHAEPGAPPLVRCRRCGYVSSAAAERARMNDLLGGGAHVDP
ncbi:hypothetical protein ACQE98_10055 [Ornithinimicrobium sp. W1679]|uniref:hypothetical protein n=1 Tax=unclassified Ornithinimicrobium TaxID=2615080 RepID=UPI003CED506C